MSVQSHREIGFREDTANLRIISLAAPMRLWRWDWKCVFFETYKLLTDSVSVGVRFGTERRMRWASRNRCGCLGAVSPAG